jgi:sec-independent protein translocase protein TatA
MGGLSPVHLILVLLIALLVLGPGKLPETGEALGKAIRDFRQAVSGDRETTPPSGAGGAAAPPGDGPPMPRPPDAS